ncbi:MAG: class C sortase [Ruminococcus sp.]|nr:class C sortase [Ruminococcus sp.]
MKRKIAMFFVVLIFLAGVGVMSYPLISSMVNNYSARNESYEYIQEAVEYVDEEKETYFAEADEYNKSLTSNVIITDPFDEEAYKKIGANYETTLDFNENGIIGYVDIPKIDVYLPIYHGTDTEVLSKGVGHLQNTSFPVGGPDTHSVISAHSGYPGETFFDYLTDLEVGDEFYIQVLDRKLKYVVDQIKVVLPDTVEDLRITAGADHVTLLTCTPYSINTHRLLVRGTRVEYSEPVEEIKAPSLIRTEKNYMFFLGYRIPYWVAVSVIIGFVFLVVIIVIIKIRKSRKKQPKHSAENISSLSYHSEDGD